MGRNDPLPPGTSRIKGMDGSLAFDGRDVVITHKSSAASGAGETRYPLEAIVGVALEKGPMFAGISLVIAGGAPPHDGPGNPLKVNDLDKAEASLFRDMVLRARDSLAEPNLAEQLRQLAELFTRGMLTPEEFGIAKAKALGTYLPANDPPQS